MTIFDWRRASGARPGWHGMQMVWDADGVGCRWRGMQMAWDAHEADIDGRLNAAHDVLAAAPADGKETARIAVEMLSEERDKLYVYVARSQERASLEEVLCVNSTLLGRPTGFR